MTQSNKKDEQQYAYPYSELLLKTLDAYQKSAMEAINRDPMWGTIQKWNPPTPITPWQRRKNRWSYRWRRLKGWRLVLRNEMDGWHKQEDCEW